MTPAAVTEEKQFRGHFSELLKVEWKLALREPYGVASIGFVLGLLVIFWLISGQAPSNLAGTGLNVLELYIPTIMVTGFIVIGLTSLPNTLVRDREIGWLRRVSTTPVSPSRLLAAQLVIALLFALIAVLIVIFGGEWIFGVPLKVQVPFFVLSAILSIAEIFSLGLVVTALAPSQNAASAIAGALFFVLLFFSGLWIQPVTIGGLFATVMYYSPTGAASRALLYSVFNTAPPYTTIITMIVYTALFSYVAIRYFRWE